MCESYCEHGGICILEEGHEGDCSSGYCKWPKSKSISREEADDIFMEKASLQGLATLGKLITGRN